MRDVHAAGKRRCNLRASGVRTVLPDSPLCSARFGSKSNLLADVTQQRAGGLMATHDNRSRSSMYGDNILVHVLGAQLPLTLSVERAARLVGIGRSSMYAAIKRGDISVMRLNGRTVVLTVPLLERMGLELDTAEQSDPRPSADWHGK